MNIISITKKIFLAVASPKLVGVFATVLLVLPSTSVLADIRGTDETGRPVILRNDGTWSYINPDKDRACRQYSDVAVKQNGLNVSLKCGYAGQLWNPDDSYHYDWCMKVTVADTQKGYRDRAAALERCKNSWNDVNKQTACRQYAKVAVKQNGLNVSLRCGYAGQLWNPNDSYHYDWCMKVTVADTQKGYRDRAAALERCGSGPPSPTIKYLGCFKDQGDPTGTSGRDLNGHAFNSAKMTTQLCVSECQSRGFSYAGTQATYWCFCGNSYGRSGTAGNCDLPCAGNRGEICGGAWANSVYKIPR